MALVLFANLHPGLLLTLVVVYINCGLVPPMNVEASALLDTETFTSSFPSFVTLRLSLHIGADPAIVHTPGAPHEVDESFEAIYDPDTLGEHDPKSRRASDIVMELTEAIETFTFPVPVVANPLIVDEVPESWPRVLRLDTVPTIEIAIDATRSKVIV